MWQYLALDAASRIRINKAIKIALIILFVIIALRIALPQLKKLWEQVKKSKEKQHIDDLSQQVDEAMLSYPHSQYGIWADSLKKAMDGWGTDEQTIYNVFGKMKTNNDIAQLTVSFGVFKDETLSQWLTSELDNSEKSTLNKVLTDKNLNFIIT